MNGIYRLVRHEDVRSYEDSGWWVVNVLGALHGFYSVLMKAPMCLEVP
jgi:hypothetical protein